MPAWSSAEHDNGDRLLLGLSTWHICVIANSMLDVPSRLYCGLVVVLFASIVLNVLNSFHNKQSLISWIRSRLSQRTFSLGVHLASRRAHRAVGRTAARLVRLIVFRAYITIVPGWQPEGGFASSGRTLGDVDLFYYWPNVTVCDSGNLNSII